MEYTPDILDWVTLTKDGVPDFRVRRPFVWGTTSLLPGESPPVETDLWLMRLLYEQMYIEVTPGAQSDTDTIQSRARIQVTATPKTILGKSWCNKRIATAAIAGVTAPVTDATPVSTITDTTEYTATISWSDAPVTFLAETVYTATITITPKTNYLLPVGADFFTVLGATATNPAGSGVVSALFPITGA